MQSRSKINANKHPASVIQQNTRKTGIQSSAHVRSHTKACFPVGIFTKIDSPFKSDVCRCKAEVKSTPTNIQHRSYSRTRAKPAFRVRHMYVLTPRPVFQSESLLKSILRSNLMCADAKPK